MDSLKMNEKINAVLTKKRPSDDNFNPEGKFKVEHYRNGQLLDTYEIHNTIMNVGKNKIFDVMFNDSTQIANSAWCIGLISLSSYSAINAADTMGSHAGWTEFTSYSESTRVAWGSGASASQTVTNATAATFSINGSGTVKGIFVTSNNTKSGTTGTLWCAGLFSGGDVPVSNGDELKITYSVSS